MVLSIKHQIFYKKIISRDCREYLENFLYLFKAIFHTQACLRLPSLVTKLSGPF